MVIRRAFFEFSPEKKFMFKSKDIQTFSRDRIYKGAVLIKEGIFADSNTNERVLYPESILSKYAKNWSNNYLNLNHSYYPLDRIGFVDNPRWDFRSLNLKADLRIMPITQNSKDTIALIDAGMINGLSIEVETDDKWNVINKCREITTAEFRELAIVTKPAFKESVIR